MAKLICLESHQNLNLYPRLKLTPGGSPYGLGFRVRQRGLPDHGVVQTWASQAQGKPQTNPNLLREGPAPCPANLFLGFRTPVFVVFRVLAPLRSAAERPLTRKFCRKKAFLGQICLKPAFGSLDFAKNAPFSGFKAIF